MTFAATEKAPARRSDKGTGSSARGGLGLQAGKGSLEWLAGYAPVRNACASHGIGAIKCFCHLCRFGFWETCKLFGSLQTTEGRTYRTSPNGVHFESGSQEVGCLLDNMNCRVGWRRMSCGRDRSWIPCL
jgi:hypothetical protein